MKRAQPHVIVIGGGFSGLAAAHELCRRNVQVTLLEQDEALGGLAGSFRVGGENLERFYHHWFTNDRHVLDLVHDLGADDQVLLRHSRTGMYYANRFFRLSTPRDLLRFDALRLVDRIRLGLLTLRARRVRDWRALESLSAEQWLRRLGGDAVYRVVWEPLLRGKFGPHAEDVSAVWFWNKLKLRGGSRGKGSAEMLAYYRGGFAALAERVEAGVVACGGRIRTGERVGRVFVENGRAAGVLLSSGVLRADAVIATPPLPLIADLLPESAVSAGYLASLRRIRYLANVCIVLQLDRSLSDTYWLNVNDPGFPFVGVIEHTNFEPAGTYGGRHIVYLSRYLPEADPLFRMSDGAALDYCLPYLARMFPAFRREWVLDSHVWRARHSQPIVERHYSRLIPDMRAPLVGLYLASMAQIYPEDRGTNYAIREGRRVAAAVADDLRADRGVTAGAGDRAPVPLS